MIDPKDVTIIIPTMLVSARNVIYECVKSLRETIKAKIVVAYNGTFIHDQVVWDENIHPDNEIQLYDQGQCRSVNAGVAITNTPWIFITNDDMIYAPNWWERLTEPLTSELAFGCISPKLIEPRAGAPTFEVYFCGGAGGDFNKEKWLEFAKNYKGQGLRTGFNLPFLIHRDIWNLISGYDINYDIWSSNSDSDLQTKIMLAGIQPYQNTDSIVYHFSMTSGTSSPENHSYWERNWKYYIDKWGFPRADSPSCWISRDIIQWDKLKFKPEWMNKYAQINKT